MMFGNRIDQPVVRVIIDDTGHIREMTFADKVLDVIYQVGGALSGGCLVYMAYMLFVW